MGQVYPHSDSDEFGRPGADATDWSSPRLRAYPSSEEEWPSPGVEGQGGAVLRMRLPVDQGSIVPWRTSDTEGTGVN